MSIKVRLPQAKRVAAAFDPETLPEIQQLAADGKLLTGTVVELEDGSKYRYTAPRAGSWRRYNPRKSKS